ncbi:MAG: ComEA family DNA-binding protein [Pyrinomonadaceae bacterium]
MDIRKPFYFNRSAFAAIAVVAITMFVSFACGGRNENPTAFSKVKYSPSAAAININNASAEELQKIPYIGEKMAGQIIEHRQRYGPFRRAEDLILIQGISDSRFRKIRSLVRVD